MCHLLSQQAEAKDSKVLPNNCLPCTVPQLYYIITYGLLYTALGICVQVRQYLDPPKEGNINSARPRDHSRPIFIELCILIIFGQYILGSLLSVRGILDSFTKKTDIHSLNTRGRQDLDIPFFRLSKKKDCFPILPTLLPGGIV